MALAKNKGLIGLKFGRLLVLSRGPTWRDGKSSSWLCRCDCGVEKFFMGPALRSNNVASCGCIMQELRATGGANKKHGASHSQEYLTWSRMISRCTHSYDISYPLYGGRGISISARWHKFENFLHDMGYKPSPDHSLDRIDSNGNYEAANCRWATSKQQARNRTNNATILYLGIAYCRTELAEKFGINACTLSDRLKRGWPIDLALSEKPDRRSLAMRKS